MIIAPKDRGWSAIVETIPQEYNLLESPQYTQNRDRFWRSLGKRVAHGSTVRIGRLS